MEKLLKLINEYEESRWKTISEETDNETEDYYDEENPLWKEYQGHLRHCNANTVAFEKDTFDAYALSKKYGFIRWLVKNGHTTLEHGNGFNNAVSEKTLLTICAISDNPIDTLIQYLS